MTASDEDLAEAARGGDASAFGVLVERHHDRVFRIAWRVTGCRADAEDIAQEVCASLPARLRGWRGTARFTTWMHRVTLNAARDALRRRATRQRAGDGWGEAEVLRRAGDADRAAALGWLEAAMARLRPDLRETVALVLGEEMSHGAAAEVLGISEGTVSWRMSEVRRILKAMAAEEAGA